MITLRPGSHAYRLLLLLAICGEYPHRSLHLLGSIRTLEELVRRLEVVQHFRTPAGADLGSCKMLTTSGKGNRRTIRLYKSALPLLQALHPVKVVKIQHDAHVLLHGFPPSRPPGDGRLY